MELRWPEISPTLREKNDWKAGTKVSRFLILPAGRDRPFTRRPQMTALLGRWKRLPALLKLLPLRPAFWLEKIRSVTPEEIKAIIEEVPPDRMSEVARRFTLDLIMANQQRLLKL
jgi:hypothetical protein